MLSFCVPDVPHFVCMQSFRCLPLAFKSDLLVPFSFLSFLINDFSVPSLFKELATKSVTKFVCPFIIKQFGQGTGKEW